MKNNLWMLATLSLLTCSASLAQITGVKESGLIRTENGWAETVTNLRDVPILALHVTLTCFTSEGYRSVDENSSSDVLFTFSFSKEIPANGVHPVKIITQDRCTGGVDAVIFKDGLEEGKKERLAVIYHQRRGAYYALSVVVPYLELVAKQEKTAAEVAAILQQKMDAYAAIREIDMNERSAAGYVFGVAISLLGDQGYMGTPSDRTPNRQPSVRDMAKSNNITTEQAHAIITKNKFLEWRSALEGHTDIPK